jgi:hypothetical protein
VTESNKEAEGKSGTPGASRPAGPNASPSKGKRPAAQDEKKGNTNEGEG